MAQPLHVDKKLFNSTSFDRQHNYFIASTNDKKLLLYRNNFKYPFLTLSSSNNSKKTALCFFDTNTIICATSNGDIEFISTCTNTSIKTINIFSKKIAQILHIPDTNYLIIHAKTDAIAIVDAKIYKIIHHRYKTTKQSIKSIKFTDRLTLHVELKNSDTIDIKLPSISILRSLVLHNSIKEAFELIDEEPMLKTTLEAINLQSDFDTRYKKAVDALSLGNENLANYLLDSYKDIETKKGVIKLLFKSFEEYDKFQVLYAQKKYAICYAISLKFPPLKMTKEYLHMQKRWEKLAKTAEEEVKRGNVKIAKVILGEFLTVNIKRPEIQNILSSLDTDTKEDKLKVLQGLYEADDFFSCYEHIDRYPELYECELGIYLQKHYQKLIFMCEEYAMDAKSEEIKTTLGKLFNLTHRKDRVQTILKISYLVEVQTLLLSTKCAMAQKAIYRYIDLFGLDEKIGVDMKKYNLLCEEKLAITIKP